MVAKLCLLINSVDKTKHSFIISGMRNYRRNSLYIFIVGSSAPPNGFDVTFQVKEKRFLTSTTGTEIGNNEGSMVSGTCPDVRIIYYFLCNFFVQSIIIIIIIMIIIIIIIIIIINNNNNNNNNNNISLLGKLFSVSPKQRKFSLNTAIMG